MWSPCALGALAALLSLTQTTSAQPDARLDTLNSTAHAIRGVKVHHAVARQVARDAIALGVSEPVVGARLAKRAARGDKLKVRGVSESHKPRSGWVRTRAVS